MYSMLFRNRVAAGAFVVLTLVSAASLVGSEDEEGIIERAAQSISEQQDDFEDRVAELERPANAPRPRAAKPQQSRNSSASVPDNIPLAEDEYLIDDAAGFDPTPPDSLGEEDVADPTEDVIIILNDETEEQQ